MLMLFVVHLKLGHDSLAILSHEKVTVPFSRPAHETGTGPASLPALDDAAGSLRAAVLQPERSEDGGSAL